MCAPARLNFSEKGLSEGHMASTCLHAERFRCNAKCALSPRSHLARRYQRQSLHSSRMSKKRQASTDTRHVCISEVRIITSPQSLSIYAEIRILTARVLTLGKSDLQQEDRDSRAGDSFCMELGVRVACLWLPRWLPSGTSSYHPIQEVPSCTLKQALYWLKR